MTRACTSVQGTHKLVKYSSYRRNETAVKFRRYNEFDLDTEVKVTSTKIGITRPFITVTAK
jgi:hypothetical protein